MSSAWGGVPALAAPRRAPLTGVTSGLPMAQLLDAGRASSAYYALTVVDARGRLADRSALRALGWEPRHRITLGLRPGVVLVQSHPDGAQMITGQGHLRFPVTVRRGCGLAAGDHLLLAAHPKQELLVAYTMATLDRMILDYHTLENNTQP